MWNAHDLSACQTTGQGSKKVCSSFCFRYPKVSTYPSLFWAPGTLVDSIFWSQSDFQLAFNQQKIYLKMRQVDRFKRGRYFFVMAFVQSVDQTILLGISGVFLLVHC